eukprot:TRINITY_DN11843_c0_g1_i1.p1 TRINITY_DN11843_c0_g1~~TRINITY_DN11843_c0_g1_i1.p1  ORF type:complete len:188 (+),score=22.72 TRINITY_DN11843_c0_g1_i1:55-618(+)
MGQTCHHTTENWGNKSTMNFPVYGTGIDNYFGSGYYFWDNNKKHAEWWGRKQYKGNFYVFEADVIIDKNRLFDVTDRNDIEELKKILNIFMDQNVDIGDYYLGTVISMLMEEEAKGGKTLFPYLYAKGVDDTKNEEGQYNPIMQYSKKAKSAFYLNPIVFFCIFRKEDVNLQTFTLVSEFGTAVKPT